MLVVAAGTLSGRVSLAQQSAKIRRIGFLQAGRSTNDWQLEAVRQRLRELGHVEGKNIVIDYLSAETSYDRLPQLAQDLVARKPDVIITAGGTPAALASKNKTASIPIVFVAVSDPVGQGIVPSLARPNGNVTGLSAQHPETAVKTIELLMEIVPSAKRVGILSNPTNSSLPQVIKDMQAAARKLKVEAIVVYARHPAEFAEAFAELARLRANSLAIVADAMLIANSEPLAAHAAKYRLPAIGGINLYPESGGLISYGSDRVHSYRRAADLVDKIMKGAKPADLPVEQPTKFELVVNLKTAKALGLTIPSTIMIRADRVIQ